MRPRVLVARLDSEGDVLLGGPALRAVAAGSRRLTLLCGPRGRQAAALLPGVDDLLVWHCPWIDPQPLPVDRADVLGLVDRLSDKFDAAIVFTSFHQSALPLALLLRMAGVPMVTAESEDYPGSLLDVRHRMPSTGLHEVERMVSTAAAAGFPLPPADNGRLAIRRPLPDTTAMTGADSYVVVHPGASVPARAWSPDRCHALVAGLAASRRRVVVTGSPGERPLTAYVAGQVAIDLGGRTELAELADVLARAEALVVGNTGPAHLAAAVGTPVVSLFAPTVPAQRWRPWQVPTVLLGDEAIACAGCRAQQCPVPGHPCLAAITLDQVLTAVAHLTTPALAVL